MPVFAEADVWIVAPVIVCLDVIARESILSATIPSAWIATAEIEGFLEL